MKQRNAFSQLGKGNGNTRGKTFPLRPHRRGFKSPIRNHSTTGGRYVNRFQDRNQTSKDTVNSLVNDQQPKLYPVRLWRRGPKSRNWNSSHFPVTSRRTEHNRD